MKKTYKLILAAIATSLMLASCSDDLFNEENGIAQSEGIRTITLSFGPQTKTALGEDGLTPEFTGQDEWVKVSNDNKSEDCQITVDDKGKASFKTSLPGKLKAVYPASAALMNGDDIEGVLVSSIQDGTFASANICMAENITDKAVFGNKTAVFCITPSAGNNTKYVEIRAKGYEIANNVPIGATYESLYRIHLEVPEKDKPEKYFVSILAPEGLTLGDLSFYDGTNEKAITTGDNASTAVVVNTIYTVTDSDWATPAPVAEYVEIAAKYDGSNVTTLRWYRQNLAITDSGKKAWKGGKDSAVKVPGTDEDVVVGDYFQWAAYENYALPVNASDKGLLVYSSFTNQYCVDGGSDDRFTFKSEKKFAQGNAPYGGENYTKYHTNSQTILERTPVNDDVASIILDGSWRMPTSAEFEVMKNATYWAWDETDKGYYVYAPQEGDAGKINKEKIESHTYYKSDALLFFPAAGSGEDNSLNGAGEGGLYWSSISASQSAYCLTFYRGNVEPLDLNYRYYGFSVRPVKDAIHPAYTSAYLGTISSNPAWEFDLTTWDGDNSKCADIYVTAEMEGKVCGNYTIENSGTFANASFTSTFGGKTITSGTISITLQEPKTINSMAYYEISIAGVTQDGKAFNCEYGSTITAYDTDGQAVSVIDDGYVPEPVYFEIPDQANIMDAAFVQNQIGVTVRVTGGNTAMTTSPCETKTVTIEGKQYSFSRKLSTNGEYSLDSKNWKKISIYAPAKGTMYVITENELGVISGTEDNNTVTATNGDGYISYFANFVNGIDNVYTLTFTSSIDIYGFVFVPATGS